MKNKIVGILVCTLLIATVVFSAVNAGSPGPPSTWESPIQLGSGNYYSALHAVDLDGDGVDEVLAGNRTTDKVEIWSFNVISSDFEIVDSIAFPNDIHDITTGDYDEDGDIDIATAIRWIGIYAAFNQGTGWSSPTQIHSQYGSDIITCDLNGDSHLDLFTRQDTPGQARIFYGDGTGNFVADTNPIGIDSSTGIPNPSMPASGFHALYPEDIDGDGDLDLFGCWFEGGWSYYPGDRQDVFIRGFINKGNDGSGKVIWGVNANEVLGYFIGDNHGVGYWFFTVKFSAGDVNGDGYLDFVAYNWTGNTIVLLKGYNSADGKINWTAETIDTVPGWTFCRLKDINNDGYLDIISSGWNSYTGLRIYYGNGVGGFSLDSMALSYGLRGGGQACAIGDFNGDGFGDMAMPRYTTSDDGFEVWIQSPPPIVDITIDIKPGGYPNSINPKSKGNVPVAVLTTDDFDATTVDPTTVVFLDATPCKKEKLEDVDDDGDVDMLFHFKTRELDFGLLEVIDGMYWATLSGDTADGTPIEGKDTVVLVQSGGFRFLERFESIIGWFMDILGHVFPFL